MGGQIGGAMNADNFRQSVDNGYLPSVESITSKGVFAEYYFDTGMVITEKVLEPTYSFARCLNPTTKEVEDYFALGLNCADDGKNIRRELNCVIVLDISGSMGSPFAGDYRPAGEGGKKEPAKTKMEIANEMLCELLKIMGPKDNLGIVLFDTEAVCFQPIRSISSLNIEELSKKIMEIKDRGGTNFEIGQSTAIKMLEDFLAENEKSMGNDNRIIFLTDACPNVGGGKDTLLGMSKIAAKKSQIYTTFFGVGLDFNVELVEEIGKVRGSNYFSVHSRDQFKKILVEDFNYIVTPVCYGTLLFLESEAYEIEAIHGAQFDKESTSTLLNVETVCAGPKSEKEGLKGGMILVKLKEKLTPKLDPSKDLKFTLKYENRDGEKVSFVDTVNYEQKIEEMVSEESKIFESNGVRKAVLLARYVDFMKYFIQSIDTYQTNKKSDEQPGSVQQPPVVEEEKKKDMYMTQEPKKEIDMPDKLRQEMVEFIKFYKTEMEAIGDEMLGKELDVLDKIRYSKRST